MILFFHIIHFDMRFLATIIFFLSLTLTHNVCLNLTCPSNCYCCSAVDVCNNCNSYYRLTSYNVIKNQTVEQNTTDSTTNTTYLINITQLVTVTIKNCTRCIDPSCVQCIIIPGRQQCTACSTYYGVNQHNKTQCNYCDATNAQICQPLNHCNSGQNCTDCPNFYFDVFLNKCFQCSSIYRYCSKCDSTQCNSCLLSYYMNTTNNKECIYCYFPNCQICNDGPVCARCVSGFYLVSGSICRPCIQPCITCDINGCLTCNSTGSRFILSARVCVPCYNFPNTTNCSSCRQDLNGSAVIGYTCLSCLPGYFLINGQNCDKCNPICPTCSNSIACLSCLNNSYYLTASSTCDLCNSIIGNCSNCLNANICINCSYGFVVALSSDKCTLCTDIFGNCQNCTALECSTCMSGYYLSSGQCVMNLNCDINCRSCQTYNQSRCVLCFDGLYLDSTKRCISCPSNCSTCAIYNSTVSCLTCPQGAFLSNFVCTPCPNGTYYLNTVESCLNCSTYCINCTVTGCTLCQSPLFEVSPLNGQCQELCGDGNVISLPCDGGKGVSNDGCADDCSIEPYYTCTYTNITNPYASSNASVKTSQCSYIGPTTIFLSKVSQSLYSNSLMLTFQVKPYLFGLPNGTETQTYLKSIYQLAPLDQLTYYSINVNPQDQTVAFYISYPTDISNCSMSFKINFASLASNVMFQNMSNQSLSLQMMSIIAPGRLGKFYSEDQYTFNKVIFVVTACMVGLGYLLLFLGIIARQLAGLEHMLLCQTVFLLLLFKQENNLHLQGFLGLKYSLSLDIFNSQVRTFSNSQAYFYNIDTSSFVNNFNLNFFLPFIPTLISPIFMLYRIKNKHLPVKKDFGRSASQLLIGYMPLYFVVFNFNGLVSYAYLYFQSSQQQQFLNLTLILGSALFTIFAWSNLFFRPEVVGSFRSAFSSYKPYLFYEPKNGKLMKKIQSCIGWRPNEEKWKQKYRMLSINFYFVLLGYQISSVYLIMHSYNMALLILQLIVFVLLFIIKPYLKLIQKFRALFTYLILILSNLFNLIPITNITIPAVIVCLLSLHLCITAYIIIKNAYLQILKKCTQRSEVVRQLFKEEKQMTKVQQVEFQKDVVEQLIQKYRIIDKPARLEELSAIQERNSQNQGNNQDNQDNVDAAVEQVSDHEYLITEQRIICEQNKHLRYLDGMNFIEKYGYEVDQDFVKRHYRKI